jgi:hypothetical protein
MFDGASDIFVKFAGFNRAHLKALLPLRPNWIFAKDQFIVLLISFAPTGISPCTVTLTRESLKCAALSAHASHDFSRFYMPRALPGPFSLLPSELSKVLSLPSFFLLAKRKSQDGKVNFVVQNRSFSSERKTKKKS